MFLIRCRPLLPAVLFLSLLSCTRLAAADCGETVASEDLIHRRFVLSSLDGEPIRTATGPLTVEFLENFMVSGQACNAFRGQGELRNGILTVSNMIMTRRFCLDETLNRLDAIIGQLFAGGAEIDLEGNRLVLSGDGHRLEYYGDDWKR
ncbi:MAG: META domain-containing protein [Planctomycetota bacterium]|jgi:heat shock protein HslJ|nr:META domain-containing protein [Planctomycetota bacterium]